MTVYKATEEEENKEIAFRYKDLLKTTYQKLSSDDIKLIRKAFEIALKAHANQRRKTEEPYIFHPIAVAKIVALEIGLGATGIAAALLHDVVEDSDYTVNDIEREFGHTIAIIVKGLTKICKIDKKDKDEDVSLQIENFRKLLLSLNVDVRVVLIKIADRLHNMQDMEVMPRQKQIQKASETLYIYAPLAHRLGLYNIKTELEDLGLKYTNPKAHARISKKIAETETAYDQYLDDFIAPIKKSIKERDIDCEIKYRFKSVYSIYKKMKKQQVNYEGVFDKYAIRIIYKVNENEKKDAWNLYCAVTDNYRPMPDRLRDWISSPRDTGYEALHLTVNGPEHRWVEVQIRSERMNEIAERGYAAHFKYKQGNSKTSSIDKIIDDLRDGLEEETLHTTDFIDGVNNYSNADHIYVYSPKGDIKELQKGATALDFAFAIHTTIGLTCRGVKVNAKMVPIGHKLKTGDIVNIITSNKIKPKSRWLDNVVTSRAKAKIRIALKAEEKAIAEEGKEILKRKLRHLKLKYDNKIIHDIANYLKYSTSFELFYKIGNGTVGNSDIKEFANNKQNKFIGLLKKPLSLFQDKKSTDLTTSSKDKKYNKILFGDDNQKLDYHPAPCCNPVPENDIFGIFTAKEGLKVHKFTCPNAIFLQSNYKHRIISAKWISSDETSHEVSFKLKGVDNKGILQKVITTINDFDVELIDINFKGSNGYFKGFLKIKVENKKSSLIKSIKIKLREISEINKIIIKEH